MEFALLVWFIEVFTPASFVMSTGSFFLLSFAALIVTGMIAGLISCDSPEIFGYWWNFVKTKVAKPWCWVLGLLIVANSFGSLMPNKDAAYKIAAAYGVQQAYEAASGSEDVKRMAGKSLRVLETSMDRYLVEGLAEISEAASTIPETASGAASSASEVVAANAKKTVAVLTPTDVEKVKDAVVDRLVDELAPEDKTK